MAASPAAGTGAPIQMLGSGETGKRQIRDSVLRAQPAIESCVGDQIQRKQLSRAEGVLKLTVAANGTPPLYYQWSLSGANLPGAAR